MQKMIDDKDTLLQAERKNNGETQLKIRREAEQLQKQRDEENSSKILKLQTDYTLLEKTHGMKLTKLRAEWEVERSKKDATINIKALEITRLSAQIQKLDQIISQQIIELKRYEDVDDQLQAALRSEQTARLDQRDL